MEEYCHSNHKMSSPILWTYPVSPARSCPGVGLGLARSRGNVNVLVVSELFPPTAISRVEWHVNNVYITEVT